MSLRPGSYAMDIIPGSVTAYPTSVAAPKGEESTAESAVALSIRSSAQQIIDSLRGQDARTWPVTPSRVPTVLPSAKASVASSAASRQAMERITSDPRLHVAASTRLRSEVDSGTATAVPRGRPYGHGRPPTGSARDQSLAWPHFPGMAVPHAGQAPSAKRTSIVSQIPRSTRVARQPGQVVRRPRGPSALST